MNFSGTVFAFLGDMRTALFSSLLLTLATGCGDGGGLTIEGLIQVDADGTETGFDFPEETRLVDLSGADATGSRLAGSCQVTGEDVAVVVRAPGPPPEGLGLHRVELSVPAEGASGFVIAQLGADEYSAALGAGCTAEVRYLDDDGGEVTLGVDCALEGPDAAAATLVADIELEGCSFE